MKATLIMIGKTEEDYIKKGISIFENRLKHYIPFETIVIPALKNSKNLTFEQQKEKEGELLLKQFSTEDYIVLLDENGEEFKSTGFANFFQKHMNASTKNLVFVIGGPFGFSQKIYQKANMKLSLSKMTFSHQMIRMLFIEQVYRAMTILRNEPYHHE